LPESLLQSAADVAKGSMALRFLVDAQRCPQEERKSGNAALPSEFLSDTLYDLLTDHLGRLTSLDESVRTTPKGAKGPFYSIEIGHGEPLGLSISLRDDNVNSLGEWRGKMSE
jgi:hypothetical protein